MTQEITITRLGHQGDGIAPGPVYVPRSLPGEVVSGTPEGDRLADMRVVTPSPHRVAPPCRHYRACGGCQLQHASDGFVAEWKQEVVRAALAAQGIEAVMRPVHTSPPQSRRRATIAVRRTKKGALAGFHGRASDVITEIPDCHLLDPALLAAIPMAEALAMLGGSRKGVMAVTLTLSVAGLDVAVRGGKPLDGPLEVALGQLAEVQGLARLAWEDEVIAMRHPPAQNFGKAASCRRRAPFCRPPATGNRRCWQRCGKRLRAPAGSPICLPAAAPLPCRWPKPPRCTRSRVRAR